MIECVTWATERRFAGEPISQQFHLRYQSSILREEWTKVHVNPSEVSPSYEEVDQYDTRYSEYLIKRDKRGRALGSIRTGPTTVPYMLRDHFSATVEAPYFLPNSSHDHELSRLVVNSDILSREESKAVTSELLLAAQERGLQRGITAYWGIVLEVVANKVFRRVGYDVEITGGHVTYASIRDPAEKIYGVKLPVNETVYKRCQERSGISGSVLNFGYDAKGHPYPVLNHQSPILSDNFFQSPDFEKETGRKSIHQSPTPVMEIPVYG